MLKNKTARVVVIGTAVLAVLAGAAVATTANAATQANGSQAKVYVGDSLTDALVPAGTIIPWDQGTFGFPDSTNVVTPYSCPADATGSVAFLAPATQEATFANWVGTAGSGFVPGTKTIQQFDITLSDHAGTQMGAVKAAGGNYSAGVACTVNNQTKLASTGLFFASVHIKPGGTYTVDQPTEDVVVVPPAPPVGSQALTLKATTAAATNGTLSLLAPASSTVLIGSPVVDPTTHLSVSTGTLGNVTVSDGRILTHEGWDLTTSVTAFTLEGDSTKTIASAQLGLAPKIVSKPTNSVITAATAQVAGSAAYTSPFASADNGVNTGNTVLDADLTFIAPSSAQAGTYDSTLTLTLTSK